jgi:CRP/FNR family transcriptional regulator, cyclic AMP receptor protein
LLRGAHASRANGSADAELLDISTIQQSCARYGIEVEVAERKTDTSAGVTLADHQELVRRDASLIERLSPAERERVRQHGSKRVLQRGESVFEQGQRHDGIAIIESGLVRSFYTSPTGRQLTLAYWFPGNFVGGPEIFGGGVHMWAAVAAQRSTVTLLPGDRLRALAREVPDLALGIIDALVFKAKCYSSLAQMLGTRSLSERLTQVLLHLTNTYGVREKDGIAVAAFYTHAEIANMIGSTRQWVTVSLNRLQRAGILTQKRGVLILIKPDELGSIDPLLRD